jgi:hypothetical protein
MNKYQWHSSLNRKMGIERPVRWPDYYELLMVMGFAVGTVVVVFSFFFALICA